MTPRDELRERIARAICDAHDTGAGWDDWAADRQQLYLSMADAALGEVAPVLQALDWYGDESNYDEDGVPGEYVGAATDPETGAFEGEWDPDRGATARAALDGTPSLPAGGGDGRELTDPEWHVYGALLYTGRFADWPDERLSQLAKNCVALVAPVSSSAADDPDPVELGYGDTDLFAGPAGDEAREALARARASVQDASEMQCRCTGYYRCLGCEREVAEAAGEALEDIDAALAALSSPLPGAGDGRSIRWFRVTNGFDGPVPLEDRHRTYESAAAELPRLDREFPAYAPFKVQTQVETHSGWVDAPAPADVKETTR